MADAARVIVMTPDELRALVRDAVREALAGDVAPVEWLDARTVAKLLAVNPRTVAKLAAAGEIPSSRIGRLLRFRRKDVDAYLSGESD